MFSALRTRVVLLGALFIFAYQGTEVSIAGWVISFLITVRKGDPNAVGYMTAGFWAGITIGRLVLSHPAHRIGEKPFVVFATASAAVFQVLVCIGVISAFGSSGGAVAPFTTGILAQAAGTWVLHPIAIGLFAVMMASWYGVPYVRKRKE
ncbi:major facilitator superfamily transporter [Colletotrichum sojae]|uniref:Major facilitator superfamily transporter n=1 Tax=Colletotrichum sojae TaxID=2175907 RepID=A0A8H6MI98_9PEZI|nr:major facilitator superfamily transporter [Colletotrichum sojae]